MTQEQLAADAGLSVPTVRLLERTRGNLASWNSSLRAHGLEVAGRNLPAGDSLGERIAALRKGLGFTRRSLAEFVGVTHPTILALERHGRGRLEILDRVLSRLDAGAYLIACGEKKAFFSHAGNSSTHRGWETPAAVLETLDAVFGRFDLDPCSPRRTRPPVKAGVHNSAIAERARSRNAATQCFGRSRLRRSGAPGLHSGPSGTACGPLPPLNAERLRSGSTEGLPSPLRLSPRPHLSRGARRKAKTEGARENTVGSRDTGTRTLRQPTLFRRDSNR